MTDKPWPPIITAARVPRFVVWRDRLLTIAMWFLLFLLLRRELLVTLEGLGREGGAEPDWWLWWERLSPYLAVSAVLGLWLVVWDVVTLRRIRRNQFKPAPPPLGLAEQARRAGCSEGDLATWRGFRIARVHLSETGTMTVERIDPPPAGEPAAGAA